MSMTTAVSNFLVWRERQQARQDHERLETEESAVDHPLREEEEQEQESTQQVQSDSDIPNVETVSEDSDEEGADIENQQPGASSQQETELTPVITIRERSRRSISLSDLVEERELARRRTSMCVLLSVFVLFRLWIQAVATGDFFLLLLCLVGTSWTTKFIRHTREREEALDRLIREYSNNPDGEGITDHRLLSFEEQLARAILDSQRLAMEGGYGNPDGSSGGAGVSEEAMTHWDKFQFKPTPEGLATAGYGSVIHDGSKDETQGTEEEPHCSICLSEYEEGEQLVCLPCKHVYHEDCISSWCTNHIRCPLCNLDLESVSGDSASNEV